MSSHTLHYRLYSVNMVLYNLNAIIVHGDIDSHNYNLCCDLLINNKINKSNKRIDYIDLDMVKNNTCDRVSFIPINNDLASYETLVSIFKPHGFKVVNTNKFNKILPYLFCDENIFSPDFHSIIDPDRIDHKLGFPSWWCEQDGWEDLDEDGDPVHKLYNELYEVDENHGDYYH
jgi:hypothetical protein